MFCKNCGKEIDEKSYVCPYCGIKTDTDKAEKTDENSGSRAGWGILSFLIPLVGLILFLTWKQDRPKTAKVCGISALVSVVLNVILSIIVYAVALGMLGTVI